MPENNIIFAFLLTLFAGLSTGIGSLIAFVCKHTNRNFLSLSLGFSAGVMIYVSMIEIIDNAKTTLIAAYGEKCGNYATVAAFFGGMIIIALTEKILPNNDFSENTEISQSKKDNKNLMQVGILTALAIAIHNFPEGLATFISALQEPEIAIPLVCAIAIHNIPEGIAVSVPVYQSTGSKSKAFIYSFLSGLAEPLGAVIGYLILRPFLSQSLFGIVFALVAGIMVYISFNELIPTAAKYGSHTLSFYGLIFGMLIMAVSLLLFI